MPLTHMFGEPWSEKGPAGASISGGHLRVSQVLIHLSCQEISGCRAEVWLSSSISTGQLLGPVMEGAQALL